MRAAWRLSDGCKEHHFGSSLVVDGLSHLASLISGCFSTLLATGFFVVIVVMTFMLHQLLRSCQAGIDAVLGLSIGARKRVGQPRAVAWHSIKKREREGERERERAGQQITPRPSRWLLQPNGSPLLAF